MPIVKPILDRTGTSPNCHDFVGSFKKSGMNRHRILVIDDDPLFRSLIMSIFRKEYVVTAASEGSEGYYKSIENPPHLIIVDVLMPGWDGLRTVEAIRAHQVLAHIPIMMLTSDSSPQTVVAAMQRGANDYVIKTTLTREVLLKKASQLINFGVTRIPAGDGDSAEAAAIDVPATAVWTTVAGGAGSHSEEGIEAVTLRSLIDNWE